MFQSAASKEGRRTSTEGPNRKQVPCMGSEMGEIKINGPSNQDQNKRSTNICAYITWNSQEILYGGSICQRAKWEPNKFMQDTWGTGNF